MLSMAIFTDEDSDTRLARRSTPYSLFLALLISRSQPSAT